MVATDVIRAGDVVSMDNVEQSGEGSTEVDADLIGREVIRTVYAGQEIREPNTRAPRLVKRNQPVTVKYKAGALEISLTGRAMGEASVGEMVSVMNLDSKKIISGTVTQDGWILAQ